MSEELYSFTKLDTYHQCPFKYYLQYVKKLKVSAIGIALDLGKEIHSIEERIGNNIKNNETINYTALKNELLETKYDLEYRFNEEFVTPDKYGHFYNDKIYGYLESGIYRLENRMKANPDVEIVGTEIPIDGFEYDGHKYRGSIDRLIRNKITGQYTVQDIKTYGGPVEPAKLKSPMQLAIYALAASKKFNAPISMFDSAYDLPFCDVVQQSGVTKAGIKIDNWVDMAVSEVNNIFDSIGKANWKPKPSALCHWCPFCHTNKHQPAAAVGTCPYGWIWTKENPARYGLVKWTDFSNYQDDLKVYLAKLNIEKGGD